MWGGAWVRTDSVEGVAYFGMLDTGCRWYGAAPMYAQPPGGGVPVKYFYSSVDGPSYGNGNKIDGLSLPYFFTFNHEHLMEVVATPPTRSGNSDDVNPVEFSELFSTFGQRSAESQGIIATSTYDINPASGWYGYGRFVGHYAWGHCVVFDTQTNQLIVLLSNGTATYQRRTLAFFQVR